MEVIALLAAFGLAFMIKEKDGPFDIIIKARSWVLANKHVGKYFYDLLSCYFCLGVQTGILTCIIYTKSFQLNLLFCWGLASGVTSLILSKLIERLHASQA